MRAPLEIVQNLKNVTYWSQPNLKYDEMMSLLNELETSLTLSTSIIENSQETIIEIFEEPIVEEVIAEEVIEEPIVEEVVEETPVVEEPIVEEVAVKPTNKRPRKK